MGTRPPAAKSQKLPPDVQHLIDRIGLIWEATINEVDSRFQERFAAPGAASVELLEQYLVERFETVTFLMPSGAIPLDAKSISHYESSLDTCVEYARDWVSHVTQQWSDEARREVTSRIILKLGARALALKAQVKRRILHSPEFSAQMAAIQRRAITPFGPADLKRHRQQLVNEYRRQNDVSLEALARKLGISVTGIRGIIRDDRTRFSEDTKRRLIHGIGVTEELWDTPQKAP